MDHRRFGAWSIRERAYWIASLHTRMGEEDPDILEHFFMALLTATECDSDFTPGPSDYVTVDDDARRREVEGLGLRESRALGERPPKPEMGEGWKVGHKKLCELGAPFAGEPFEWPLKETPEQESYIYFGGMTLRQHEAVVLVDRYFPSGRVRVLRHQRRPRMDSEGFHPPGTRRMPKVERQCCQGLALAQSPADRRRVYNFLFQVCPSLETRQVRLLEPHEEFRLQCWDLPDWRVPAFPGNGPVTFEQLGLLSDLAGSLCVVFLFSYAYERMKGTSFSVYHRAPVLLCSLATWGRFANLDANIGDDAESESSGPASSSTALDSE